MPLRSAHRILLWPAGLNNAFPERSNPLFAHLHIFAFLAGGAIVLMIISGIVGSYLERSQPDVDQQQVLAKVFTAVTGILFLILCMAMVPLILRFFTHMQGLIGNGDLGMVVFIRRHEQTITYVVWGVIAAVLLFMLPTMIREGGPISGMVWKSGSSTIPKA